MCVLGKIKRSGAEIPELVKESWLDPPDNICASAWHLASLRVCYSNAECLIPRQGRAPGYNPTVLQVGHYTQGGLDVQYSM